MKVQKYKTLSTEDLCMHMLMHKSKSDCTEGVTWLRALVHVDNYYAWVFRAKGVI